jgi:hypothetical protein
MAAAQLATLPSAMIDPYAEVHFLGDRSLRTAVPRWHEIARGKRARKQFAEKRKR